MPDRACARPANVLLLVHRIPFPPDKGDKIRSWRLLEHLLLQGHRVHLGAFVDDPQDFAHAAMLRERCAALMLRPLDPRRRKLASARGLLDGRALSLPYYADGAMQAWVDRTLCAAGIDQVIVFSSTMAQFVDQARHAHLRRVVDFVDVDSRKWLQYAERHHGPLAWIYRREAARLLAYERRVASEMDASLFVSPEEAALFRALAPESAARVDWYGNGVDTTYFDPAAVGDSPYPAGGPVLVFTGAMDYWANEDAVTWFAAQVLPRLRASRPDLRLWIVGSKPGPKVQALRAISQVHVTGRVPDVRPYLAHADVAIAPLRVARGIQNKVLEAMAMARPLACTAAAAEGLDLPGDVPWLSVQDEPAAQARAILGLLGGSAAPQAREWVRARFSWPARLGRLQAALDRVAAGAARG